MRVSDFIARRLKFLGCEKVFMVTGGASMHLNDSFGSIFRDNVYFLHHEQSCSISAESYSRLKLKSPRKVFVLSSKNQNALSRIRNVVFCISKSSQVVPPFNT